MTDPVIICICLRTTNRHFRDQGNVCHPASKLVKCDLVQPLDTFWNSCGFLLRGRHLLFYMINLKLYSPFSWMWFSCPKATEPLRGDSLLFTTQSPGVPGTHLIDLGRMKGWAYLGATQWFLTRDSWIGNPSP